MFIKCFDNDILVFLICILFMIIINKMLRMELIFVKNKVYDLGVIVVFFCLGFFFFFLVIKVF